MIKRAPRFIFMPKESANMLKAKQNFYQVASFQDAVSFIDGFHFPIIALLEDKFAYVYRKKFHSINIQRICDAN